MSFPKWVSSTDFDFLFEISTDFVLQVKQNQLSDRFHSPNGFLKQGPFFIPSSLSCLSQLTYMFWVQSYKLSEAFDLLMSKCSCFPKLYAIKSATEDIPSDAASGPISPMDARRSHDDNDPNDIL
ncbi:putative protein isoform X1 [Capsicum chacoense]